MTDQVWPSTQKMVEELEVSGILTQPIPPPNTQPVETNSTTVNLSGLPTLKIELANTVPATVTVVEEGSISIKKLIKVVALVGILVGLLIIGWQAWSWYQLNQHHFTNLVQNASASNFTWTEFVQYATEPENLTEVP